MKSEAATYPDSKLTIEMHHMRDDAGTQPSAVDTQPRHVAWLVQGSEGYGVRRTTLSLSRALQNIGWSVTFVAFAPGQFVEHLRSVGHAVTELPIGQIPVFHGTLLRSGWSIVRLVKYRNRVTRLLEEQLRALHPDVVHVRNANLMLAAAKSAFQLGLPLMWHMPALAGDSYPLELNRRFYRWYLKRYAVNALANSRHTASSLDTLDEQYARVLYLGVDPAQFDPGRAEGLSRQQLGIPMDAPVFGIVGRLVPQKGQDVFLRAMSEVRCADGAHVLLVGGPLDSRYALDLRRQIRDAGLEPRVHLVGPVADPTPYYRMMDVAVNSATGAEPFGLSVIEAMMIGKPVLVHALGGPKETVIDDATGWHVPVATVESFASGIQRALTARARWAEFGANARCRALASFTDSRMADNYRLIVEGALAGR